MDETRADPAETDDPLSIPIREPDPSIPRREATRWTMLPIQPIVALGVFAVVGLVIAGLLWWPSSTDPDPEVLDAALSGPDEDQGDGDGSGESDDASGAEEALTPYTTLQAPEIVEPPTTATDSTILAEDVGTAPGPAPVADTPPEPSDLPVVDPASLGATWVAQVSSVPTASGTQALSDGFAKVVEEMPGTVVLRGRDWPGLSDGYWVLAVPGFDSGAEAVDACAAAGKTDRDDCFAKYVDPDDGTPRVCYRDDSGALTGDC